MRTYACAGFLCLGGLLLLDLATHHAVGDRRSNEDRRQRTEDNTQRHSEGKALDAATTDEQDAEQHDQRRERGVDGTSQRLVDGVVEHLLDVLFRVQAEVLTDTVEHHHLIVDRVTDHRQHGTDERLVDLERERHDVLQEREQTDDGQGVEHQSGGRTNREGDVAEAQQDVEEDGDQGDEHADEGSVSDVLSNRRTHLRRADDGATLADVRILERCHVGLAHQTGLLQTFVEHFLSLVVDGGAVRLNLVVGRLILN